MTPVQTQGNSTGPFRLYPRHVSSDHAADSTSAPFEARRLRAWATAECECPDLCPRDHENE